MSTEPKPLPPPPARKAGPPPPSAPAQQSYPAVDTTARWAVTSGRVQGGERVELYGPGGIGKTTLASLAHNAVVLDVEDGSKHLNLKARIGAERFTCWNDLRVCLQSDALDGYGSIVIDSITRAEQWALAHTLATVKHEKGKPITCVEDYGFGKGYQHVYDTFMRLLPDLDRHVRAGRSVILIAHDCTADVPNPSGDDFIRFEPHLQAPKSGKGSIREAVFQWADHVLFLGYDVVTEDGKGKGAGTRTIWPVERPDHRAKSRLLSEPLEYRDATDDSIWKQLLGNGGAK